MEENDWTKLKSLLDVELIQARDPRGSNLKKVDKKSKNYLQGV